MIIISLLSYILLLMRILEKKNIFNDRTRNYLEYAELFDGS